MKTPKLPKIGAAFEGGFFAGRFFIGSQAYALIVSPKASGDFDPATWNDTYSKVPGATSYCDGLANTKAMAKAGSELAKRILALRIGKHTDWHMPSRLEQLVMFNELRELRAFKPDGKQACESTWYWSSTQHAEDADFAWCQYFGDGSQSDYRKDSKLRARAVRRIKL